MKKTYIAPKAETIDMLCEGLIASSIDQKDVHADTPQFSNKTIWNYNESEAE